MSKEDLDSQFNEAEAQYGEEVVEALRAKLDEQDVALKEAADLIAGLSEAYCNHLCNDNSNTDGAPGGSHFTRCDEAREWLIKYDYVIIQVGVEPK